MIMKEISVQLKLVMRLSVLTGTAPIWYNSSTGTVQTSWILHGLSCICLLAFDCLIVYDFIMQIHKILCENSSSNSMYVQKNIINIISASLMTVLQNYGIIKGIRRIKFLLNYLDQILEFRNTIADSSCNDINCDSKVYVAIICYMIVAPWINFLLYILTHDISVGVEVKVVYLACAVQCSTISLMMMQFVFLALHAVYIFKLINRRLEMVLIDLERKKVADEYIGSTPLRNNINIPVSSINKAIDMLGNTNEILITDQYITESNGIAQNMRLLIKTFHSICEALRKLNSFVDTEILIETLLYSFAIWRVFNNFVEVLYFTAENKSTKYLGLFVLLNWGFYISLLLYTLIEPYYRTGIEVEQTRFLLSQMMTKVNSREDLIWVEVNKFNTLLAYQNLSHSAGSICNLNRALILKIFSAVVTFSVTWLDLTS